MNETKTNKTKTKVEQPHIFFYINVKILSKL